MNLRPMVLAAALAGAAIPAAAQNTRRVQVFSETFSLAARGPYFVHLDSGVTYRIVREGLMTGDISIAPRAGFAPPVTFTPSSTTDQGAPFVPVRGGDYRIASDYTGTEIMQVRIFREVGADQLASCGNLSRDNCSILSADEPSQHHKVSPAVWVMLGLFPAFLYGVFRNGKSF